MKSHYYCLLFSLILILKEGKEMVLFVREGEERRQSLLTTTTTTNTDLFIYIIYPNPNLLLSQETAN